MSEIRFKAFKQQRDFLTSKSRIKLAAAGRRGGKTEVGAIQGIIYQETKPSYIPNEIDPYIGVLIAPTTDMLRRLSIAKFINYAKPFIKQYNKSTFEITWHDGSIIYGVSADKPERIEGIKANWIWCDEITQIDKQIFLEARARVADTQGFIYMTGSLGVQYVNPRSHWIYKEAIEENKHGIDVHTWATADNPYFPRDELERLKESLDPRTYRAMFEIDWNIPATNRVFEDFDDMSIQDGCYIKELPVYVAVDWGWTDPTAVLFVQHDPRTDTIYVIDEIIRNKTLLDDIYALISQKPYPIKDWYCDAAGMQTREQTAKSNIVYFREKFGVNFKWRRTPILPGIALMRSYIKNHKGQRKLVVDSKCKSLIDEFTNYKFKEEKGMVTEQPEDKNNHSIDALRYFFVNYIKDKNAGATMSELDRWDILSW